MKSIALLFGISIVLTLHGAQAREQPFLYESSGERTDIPEPEKWREGGVRLPPYPEEEDLLEFQVDDPGKGFRYFVDGKHLSVGVDEVVRYTLVIRSRSGVDNVSFEGIRCNSREFKVYAYGARGQFKPLKAPLWERIKKNGPYRYHLDLRRLYFCQPSQYKPYPAPEIVRLLGETPRRADDVNIDNSFY